MMTHLVVALVTTVVVLAVVVASGITHRRQLHYGSVVAFFIALGWAIAVAERVGRGLVFDGAAGVVQMIHFGAVAGVFGMAPFLVWSGVKLAREEGLARRLLHRKLASAFLVLVLVACVLGTTMTVLARPADGAGPAAVTTPGTAATGG